MSLNPSRTLVAKAISILCLVCMLMTSLQPIQALALSSDPSLPQEKQAAAVEEGGTSISPLILATQEAETFTRIPPRPELHPSVQLEISPSLAQTFDFSKAGDGDWFRVLVSLRHPADLKRLKEWGMQILKEFDGYAYILINQSQLEKLSRLGFRPSEINSVQYLAQVFNSVEKNDQVTSQDLVNSPDLLLSLSSVDTDNDSLTDTEESWWCTNPQDNNSDSPLDPTSSNPSDGEEVNDILRGIRAYGPPFALWPQFTPHNPNGNCPDGDFDAVPDYAEEFMIGTSNLRESSDLDKFDDGQELFGVTYCPGANGPCGYGILPRAEDAAFVSAILPAWVKEPGDSPFVAAFPDPQVEVVPSSIAMTQKTVITNTKGTTIGTEKTYGTSSTQGASTSLAETETWNSWQEVSKTTALNATSVEPVFISTNENNNSWKKANALGITALALGGCMVLTLGGCGVALAAGSLMLAFNDQWFSEKTQPNITNITNVSVDETTYNQICETTNGGQITCINNASGGTVSSGQQLINASQTNYSFQDRSSSNSGTSYSLGQNGLTSQDRVRIVYPISTFTPTQTFSQGVEHGGSRTTTTTQYEEQTISESSTNQYSDSWSTATAVDSTHAADLRFTYNIVNDGTEYAREVTSLTFNIYIGNNPNPAYTYVAVGSTGQIEKIENLFPVDSLTYTSNPIALTLDEMRAIDEGAPIRIVMEDISFGQDQVFYLDALNGSVTVAMEDGYDDLDETVDTYLIPVWDPSDTVQDVAKRYFPVIEDTDGNLLAVFTPESASNIPESCIQDAGIAPASNTMVYCKHSLTGTSWWNFYLSDGLDYNGAFQGTSAAPNTTMLVRIVSDSDLDGYNNRNEIKLDTDPENPAEHPSPNLVAAYIKSCTGNDCTLRMAFQNFGNYDAYGVEAVLYSPDGLAAITNNTIGGSGRVPAGTKIVVGPSDTFQYTTTAGAAEPVIMVSYNDPQGNHRFILPSGNYPSGALISDLESDISGLNGKMLADPGVDIASTGTGQASFVINSPHPTAITNGKLFVEYIDSQGNVAHEDTYTQNFASGPTVVPVTVDLNTYPEDEYILLAFFTDSQGNIIDSSARPLASFGADPSPEVNVTVSAWRVGISATTIDIPDPWDFGIVQPGATLHGTLNIANTGLGDLRYSLIGFDQNLTLGMGSSAGTLSPSDSNAVSIEINTAGMSAGPFNKSLTLRTNDPSHGTLTIHISGVLSSPTVSTASAYAVSPYRPWDQFVYVPGPHNQNDVVSFTHTLTDDPTRMFPLYLYDETGATLKGVGEYGVDFGGQTAPFGVFGTGADGDLTVMSGQTVYTDNTRSALASTANSGQTNLVLSSASGFAAGQEVMVIQIQGTGAGLYEFKTIANVSSNTLTLNNNLTNTYSVGGISKTQVLRVMQYHDVTVQSGGILTAHAWDGSTGGIIVFRSSGITTINSSGAINSSAIGFRGGAGGTDGQAYTGEGTQSTSLRDVQNPPGNGGGSAHVHCAGGGNGTAGGSGGNSTVGDPDGNPVLSIMVFGGGGGGGAVDPASGAGVGGNGGGITFIAARQLHVSGSLQSAGGNGGSVPPTGRSGCGGAGGSIFIKAQDVAIGTNLVSASEGLKGTGGTYSNSANGGTGRIRIEYGTLTGTTNPTASTQQVNYYNITGQGTPFGVFGSGSDGDLTVTTGQTTYTDNIRSTLTATTSAGQINLAVSNVTGFTVGKEVLIIQSQGTGAGAYEFAAISSVSGNTLTLSKPLGNPYTTNLNSKAQILVVPQYQNVTVQNGGILTAHTWNGSTGGIIVFRATGSVSILGTVYANGIGYRGGISVGNQGQQGEGDIGIGNAITSPNGNAGGGGQGTTSGNAPSAGGGGGGYGSAGDNGVSGGWGGKIPGTGGVIVGTPDMATIYMGGGGGSGGLDIPTAGFSNAGNGGGVIYIACANINVSGNVSANGNDGVTSGPSGNQNGGAGGGGGGAVLIKAQTVVLGTNFVRSSGGTGANGFNTAGKGGNGGVGRIRIEYGTAVSGSTYPIADIQQVNFYNLTGLATSSLYLPDALANGDSIRYQVLYGQRGSNTDGGIQTFTVHLPNRKYHEVKLSALIERVVGSGSVFSFCLDIGNDGTCDYVANDQSFSGPVKLDSTNLASVLNAYIQSLGSSAEVLTIPIRINISTPADIFLFNLSTSLDADADLVPVDFNITPPNGNPASNIPEGSQVTLSAAVMNNGTHKAENFTVGFYNGNPATDGTLIGSTFIPSLDGGATSALQSVTWNTTGLLGTQTIYAKVDVSSTVAESNETNNTTSAPAVIKKKADLVITALTLPNTRENENGIAEVTLRNDGEADVTAAVIKLYLGEDVTGTFLGSTTLDVPQAQSVHGQISYSISTAGPHSIFALVDPDNLVLEPDENNNTRTATTLTGWDALTVDAGGANDVFYDAESDLGYGRLIEGTANTSCGTTPEQSYRQAGSAESLEYQFDNLLPGRFYHLDLTFTACSGDRYLKLRVEDQPITELGDDPLHPIVDREIHVTSQAQTVSILLDPADYADGSVKLSILRSSGLSGPMVNLIQLSEVRYCHLDSGPSEQAWSAGNQCGYDPSLPSDGFNGWGAAAYQTVRFSEDGQFDYKFSGLHPAKEYNVRLTYFEGDGLGRQEQIKFDGTPAQTISLSSTPRSILLAVSPASYADGTVLLNINEIAGKSAVISEVTLEQDTGGDAISVPPTPTPTFTPTATPTLTPTPTVPTVVLSAFTASWDGTHVTVGWSTTTEIDNAAFKIFRSADTLIWTEIATINSSRPCGTYTGTSPVNYSYTDTAVATGGTYYYRLQFSGAGCGGGSSMSLQMVSAVPLPGSFGKSSPAYQAVDQPLDLTLQWEASVNATSYEYCFDAVDDNACTSWIDNGSSISASPTGLEAGKTYYWHVRAVNVQGEIYSDGSETAYWSFTTIENPPAAFSKLSPMFEAQNQPRSLNLTWSASQGASDYLYCFDKTNDDACSNWTSSQGNTSVGINGLDPDTTYYWQVQATNKGGSTPANGGTWWTFTTVPNNPPAFGKAAPSHGATGQPLLPTLSWQTSLGATDYEYCLDTSADSTCDGAWTSSVGAISVNVNGLSAATTYYWQVRAVNPGGSTYADNEAWWTFTTLSNPPGGFSKSSPGNGATDQPTSLSLSWTSSTGADHYEYCLDASNDNTCTTWVDNGSATTKLINGLSPATTYYWHVRAVNAANTTYSNASETAFWSFTTVPNAPGAFVKLSPQHGAQAQPTSPTLTWEPSSGAALYEYCYDTSDDDVCTSWVDNGMDTSITLSNLTAGATYYWQVRAVNAGGSAYANAGTWWSFTILSNTPIFADVPANYWARPFIERLYLAAVTGGCASNPLMYCPDTSVNRAQMAIFLLRGKYGDTYLPPAASGKVFNDIPMGYWAASWIEQLAAEGVTGGCGGGKYCPETKVTRDQMAVFLLRAKYGNTYTPPAAVGIFADVPTSFWAAAWIEALAAEGITGGCGGGNYCPGTVVNRAQIAVFLVKTFNLP